VKLDQAGERLQAEIDRGQREKAAETIPGSDDTAEISHEKESLQAEIERGQREKGAGTIPGSDETAEISHEKGPE